MDKYKIYPGSAVNLPSTIDLVQSYVNGNFNKRILKLTKTFGVIDSGLAVSILNSTTLSIAEGACIFKNGEMAIVPASTLSIGSLTEGSSFILYLKFKEAQSDPVVAANSFYYNSSNVAKYTKFLDSYELLLGSYGRTEADDELHLCSFTAGPGNTINQVIGLTDLRTYFKIKTSILDRPLSISDTGSDLILKPRDGERILKIKDYNDFTLFSLDTNTGDVNYTIDENLNPTAKFTFNGPVKINGTLIVNDREVELKPLSDTPVPAPKGFRIVNISSIKNNSNLVITNKVRVYFEWNYNNLTGSGLEDGYFDLANQGYTFAVNYLEGLYFYVPSLDKNFIITNSVATDSVTKITRIRVKDVSTDSYPNLLGINVTGTTPKKPIINSNAFKYSIKYVTIENGTPVQHTLREIVQQVEEDGIVIQKTYIDLEPNNFYSFELKAFKDYKTVKPTIVELEEGNFLKYGIQSFYSKPALIRHPIIPTDNASLTLERRNDNLNITVNGFSEADYFEYILGDTTQFNNSAFPKKVISSRTSSEDISISSGNITVSIRPMIGGQEVGLPISATVTVGNNITTMTDVPLFTVPIMHNTVSGTLTKVSNSEVILSNIQSPAGEGETISYVYSPLLGDTLRDFANKEYIITNAYPGVTPNTYVLIISKGAGNTSEVTAGACKIGTGSVRSRLITNIPVSALLEITKLAFDLDSIHLINTNDNDLKYVNLRVYASNNLNSANIASMQIREGVDEITIQNLSAKPLIADGTINQIALSVDLYDPIDTLFENVNKNGVSGTLFIYGKYKTSASVRAIENNSISTL